MTRKTSGGEGNLSRPEMRDGLDNHRGDQAIER